MTAITISDPQQLKEVVLDVLKENPDILIAAIKELLEPAKKESHEEHKERMRALIQEDFDRYENVFKALREENSSDKKFDLTVEEIFNRHDDTFRSLA
jgi:hypothetical protein